MNSMRTIRIEKLTLNIGAGKDAALLEKGVKLIKQLTGIAPVKTVTQKRIPGWGLRPGLPIGCKVTIRGPDAMKLIARLLAAKDKRLDPKNFDVVGNVSFGIPEYIDIDGAKYDPEIGIIGLQVCLTLERPGYRVKRRSLRPMSIPHQHRVSAEEAMAFMKETFGVTVEEANA